MLGWPMNSKGRPSKPVMMGSVAQQAVQARGCIAWRVDEFRQSKMLSSYECYVMDVTCLPELLQLAGPSQDECKVLESFWIFCRV